MQVTEVIPQVGEWLRDVDAHLGRHDLRHDTHDKVMDEVKDKVDICIQVRNYLTL